MAATGPNFTLASFDYHAIARQLRESREESEKQKLTKAYRKKHPKAKAKQLVYTSPKVEHLSNSITAVRVHDTLEGSSTLEVELADPEFELLEFFDIDDDGKLDKIEMQYPEGSPAWWRLTGLGVSAQAGQALTLTLTFMERPAVLLLHRRGPKKGSRAKMTRAQFLRSCVKDVKAHPLKFHSAELNVKQDIQGRKPAPHILLPSPRRPDDPGEADPTPGATGNVPDPPKQSKPTDERERKSSKRGGIHPGEDVTVKGKKINRNQITQANRALDTAAEVGAPHDAAVALIMTAIAESDLGGNMTNMEGSEYSGVFAASPGNFPGGTSDTKTVAKYCLEGGRGFNCPQGGLIGGVRAMNKKGGADYRSLGHICYVNQGNLANFQGNTARAERFFGQWEGEAEDIVAAYGDNFHGQGGHSYYRAQFNFQIGTEENPKEKYWDGMRALAEDVRWRLFIDGRTVYFDSDMTLIRQQPAAIIDRTDPTVLGFDATWDGERDLATEMQLELICEPFEFRAGQVLKLRGFGPLSTGSTALPKGLPGRWLIWEIDRTSGSYHSTFTLRQPEREKMEPSNDQRRQRDEDSGPGNTGKGGGVKDIDRDMSPKEIIDELVIPIGQRWHAKAHTGGKLTAASVLAANHLHSATTTSGNPSNHKKNPEDGWAADMFYTPGDRDGDGLADELARRFGFTERSNHVYAFDQSPQAKGLQFELGWRTMVGGNHHNHVHFGLKVIDPSKRTRGPGTSSGSGGGPHGTGRP